MANSLNGTSIPLDLFDQQIPTIIDSVTQALRQSHFALEHLPVAQQSHLAQQLTHALREALIDHDAGPLLHTLCDATLFQTCQQTTAPPPQMVQARLHATRKGSIAGLKSLVLEEPETGFELVTAVTDLFEQAVSRLPSAPAAVPPAHNTIPSHTYQALVENALDGIALADMSGRVTYGNPAFVAMSGMDPHTTSRVIADYFDAEMLQKVTEEVQPALQEVGRWVGELRYRRPDGSSWYAECSAFLVTDATNTPIGQAIIVRDITSLRAQDQRLRTFYALAENMPYGVAICELDGTIRYANPAYRQTTGYGTDIFGTNVAEFIAESAEDMQAIGEGLLTQRFWQGQVNYRRQDSSTFVADVLGFVVPDENGEAQAIAAVLRDITEQLHSQHALLAANERIERSFEATPLATIEWDTSGTVLRWNPSAVRIFGWSAEEAIGQNIVELLAPAIVREHVDQVVSALLRGEATNSRNVNITKDGREITCQWYNTVLRDSNNQVIGALSQTEDVTKQIHNEQERTTLQEQVIEAQRAALRELSTPLIPLAEDVVAMPLIGSIDTARAQEVLETLLTGVADTRARTAIIDITGVPVVDTQVANALLRAAHAVKLLGARVVITGIRPEVAQTLVGLGVDLGGILTLSTLQSGIAMALRQSGR